MQLPWTTRLYHFVKGPNPLHPQVWAGRLSPLTFRSFETGDLAQCMELYTLNEPSRFPEGVKEAYANWLNERRAYVLVAEKDGRILASGGIHRVLRHDLAMLCFGLVHPQYQGRGIGAALVLTRLALLDPAEPTYAVLISALAKSIGYYRRFGFRRFAPWKDHHGQQHPSGLLGITADEIRRCRALLAQHQISIPAGDNLVPFHEKAPLHYWESA